MLKNNLKQVLHEMEEVTKLFKLEPFDIYIIGGGACILGEYTVSTKRYRRFESNNTKM